MVAREAKAFILLLLLLAVVAQVLFGLVWALAVFGLAVLVAWLFRDPNRRVPNAPAGILSPADARVLTVKSVQNPYADESGYLVRLKMHFWGVYALRSPIEGKVVTHFYEPRQVDAGRLGLPASVGLATWLQSDEGESVVVVVYRRVRCCKPQVYLQPGERVGQGHRLGFVPFGTDVDVFVPSSARVEVGVGAHVIAGSGLLANIVRKHTVVNTNVVRGGGGSSGSPAVQDGDGQ